MREILFRGKRTDNGEWVEGDFVHGIMKHEEYSYIWSKDEKSPLGSYEYVVTPETVCQYIGWDATDRTKIFDADIIDVTYKWGDTDRILIWWNKEKRMITPLRMRIDEKEKLHFNGQDYIGGFLFDNEDFDNIMRDPYGDNESIKVVGNVYDNPELLEAK